MIEPLLLWTKKKKISKKKNYQPKAKTCLHIVYSGWCFNADLYTVHHNAMFHSRFDYMILIANHLSSSWNVITSRRTIQYSGNRWQEEKAFSMHNSMAQVPYLVAVSPFPLNVMQRDAML